MRRIKLLPILAIFAAVFIYFSPFLTHFRLPIPSDAIVGLYNPYRDVYSNQFPHGYPFKNFLITDPLRQQYPWREIAISGLEKLRLPLWNPYNGAGEPLLGNIQSGALYPFNILFFIFPFSLAWTFLIILQPLLAGLFLYFYLTNIGLSRKASLLGALTFAFSGFNTAWLEWGTIVHTGIWLPLALLSIDKIFNISDNSQKSKIQLKIKKYQVWSVILLLSLCSSFFAGHLQTFFYLFLLSLVYFFMRWYQYCKDLSHLFKFLLIIAVFFLITFVQWWPSLQLINNSARAIDRLWQTEGWFIPYHHLVQFIAPDFFGNPSTQNYWGTWNYGELVGYIGIFPLLLALNALFFRRDKHTLFFSVLTFASLLFALPTFVAKIPFILHVPFLSTAQPTRLLYLVCFGLSVLSALGFDYFYEKRKSIFVPIIFVLLLLLGLWAVLLFKPTTIAMDPQHIVTAKSNLKLPTILLADAFALSLFWAFLKDRKITKDRLFVVILLLVCFDLIRFSWKFNTFTDKSLLYPPTKTVSFLQSHTKDYPWRFLGVDYVKDQKRVLPPNLSAHDRLYTLDVYNPLLLRRYQEFAAISEWGFTDVPDFSFNRAIILNNYDSNLVDFMGVKYVVSINDIFSKKLKFVTREGDTRVYENISAFPRAFMVYSIQKIENKKDIAKKMYHEKTDLKTTAIIEEDSSLKLPERSAANKVTIANYSENAVSMYVTTNENGFLVLTDTFYPTWHAKIDDKEVKIYRADYAFRGVFVPKGKHKIVFQDSLF